MSTLPTSASKVEPNTSAHQNDILWLGAHKTGTTYLQNLLMQSRTALAGAELLYVGMEAFRSLYTRPLLYGGSAAGSTPPLPSLKGRYLLFDENILGLVQDVVTRYGLYPNGAERAAELATALKLDAPDIVLGIRGFSGYLPSLYCEALKSTPFQPFDHFQVAPLTALSWCDLIERLMSVFPHSRIVVYQAEDLRGREQDLLGWVTGLKAQEIPNVAGPQRERFSQKAVDKLHQLHQNGPIDTALFARCLREFPKTSENKAFNPWNTAQERDLAVVYDLDIKAIKALERVDFWAPG